MVEKVARVVRPESAKHTKRKEMEELARVGATPPRPSLPSEDEIRLRAYQKWEDAGKPSGDDLGFWLEAERELLRTV